MELPFTEPQFFQVIRLYNESVWPMQVVLNLLSLAILGMVVWRRPWSGIAISVLLALLWVWTGVAYHLVRFTAINPAAWGFGVLWLLGGASFLWAGVVRRQLAFRPGKNIWTALGALSVAYALVIYPVLGTVLGHGYPDLPTFGLPCPTTIFTVGMLCFLARPFPRHILVAPLLWSLVGAQAAILFGVHEDLGLAFAGLAAVTLMVIAKRPGAD